jgi:predicted nucleic acid-binding protein
MIVNARKFPEIKEWLQQLVAAGEELRVPEICDYELRRGLLRLRDSKGIERLDYLCANLGYLPITTAAMHKAAELWAAARHRGAATAPDLALDGDVILAAQALVLGASTVIATENPRDLIRYTAASAWNLIIP